MQTVPAGSVLVIRASGASRLDVVTSGGLAEASREGAPTPPAGTEEHRYVITDRGTATLQGVLDDDVTFTFAAIPDRAPTIALTKDPEPQARGSLQLTYKIEDDYGVDRRAGDLRAQAEDRPPTAARRARSTARRTSRWCCRRRARATAPARPPRISPIIRGPAPMSR